MTSPHTPGDFSDAPPDPGRLRTRARERTAIRWGFLVSVVVHLIAIALYPVLVEEPLAESPPSPEATPDEVLPGFEVVTLRNPPEPTEDTPLPDPPPPELEEPDEEEPLVPTVELPTPPSPDPVPEVEVEEVEEDVEDDDDLRSIAERLRPGPADPRLWSYLLPDRSDLSDAERANLLLEGMLETFNDSVAVAAALRGQMEDWTYTDDEGRRWGLSPGRLHLGEFSIPLPFYFDIPPGLANDFGRRDWEIADLLRGATQAEIRQTWSQRAREIRERMDAERNRNGSGGGG